MNLEPNIQYINVENIIPNRFIAINPLKGISLL